MAAVILRCEGLTRHFGGLTAVNDVTMEIPEGQIRALIGPNGAGKSTLVGMLCGRIEASSGRVWFQGEEISGLPAHTRIARGMAYTFQITSIFGRLSLHENVALAVRRIGARDVDTRVTAALDQVGLASQAGQIAGDLSYGHQRLLEIAMGLGQDPKLLILDEPTQGLSDSEVASFNTLIREMAGRRTILLIEHNMQVVMETADVVTVLNFGEVLAEGTPQDIRADKAVQHAYLGTVEGT
ncbi:MAG: ABC transporter ATP-binding protein [Pseudomonadota bacterium]